MRTPEWIEAQLQYSRLGHGSRTQRLGHILTALDARPNLSVPNALGNTAATKATYRFWDSSFINEQDILSAMYRSTGEGISEQGLVLAVQDTTELDFTKKRATQGLGYLDSAQCQGLKLHTVLAVSTEGVPLGILDQQPWVRDPETKGKKDPKRPITQKESFRWYQGVCATENVVKAQQRVLVIADRESDIFDVLAMPRRQETDLLIRAHYNRRLAKESIRMREALERQPIIETRAVAIQRARDRKAYTAELSIRFAELELAAPQQQEHRLLPQRVCVLLVREEAPPPQRKAIEWLLVTTLAITTAEEAFTCVRYYSYRWLIERFHYVLKSGCRLEDLQLKEADRLKRATATFSYIAWRQLWLCYEARVQPEQSCEVALSTAEWEALYCTTHKTTTLPSKPPSLQQAVRWIAMLGGFLARKGDGDPGVKVLWRGLRRLGDITDTYQLFQGQPAPIPHDTSSG